MVNLTDIIKRAKVLLVDARADCEVDEAGVALPKISAAIALLDRVRASLVGPAKVVDARLPKCTIVIDDRTLAVNEQETAPGKTSRPRPSRRVAQAPLPVRLPSAGKMTGPAGSGFQPVCGASVPGVLPLKDILNRPRA